MAKLGIAKNLRESVRQQLTNHPNLVKNKWLGFDKAFEIEDPANKLITMVGSGFFNEPRYYDDSNMDSFSLSEQAQEVIDTAVAVALSENPRDLWVISQWAREELNIRTTPNVLSAVGCHFQETKPWAREYIPKIATRADEPIQVFAAYLNLFGKPLPNCLRRGLADAISKFSEWELVRYSGTGSPNIKDLLLMVDRKNNYPVKKELFEYLVNGKIVSPEATPIIFARKELAKRKEFDDKTKSLIKKGKIPWEVVVTQFGSRKEVWEFLIKENLLGYMAMLRNLRNIEDAEVCDQTKRLVKEKLIGGAGSSKLLPFRFLAARENIGSNWAASAVDLALDKSIENVPEVSGKTAVLVDLSGSMEFGISQRSNMSCKDIAVSLAAILGKKYGAENVSIYAFGNTISEVNFSDADSVMNIIERIKSCNVGHATFAHKCFEHFSNNRIYFDRIILLSDMQCYSSNYCLSKSEHIQTELEIYRRTVNNNVFLHSIDLQGYGLSSVAPNDSRVQLLGGWSENVFNLIRTFEGVEEGTSVPSIEVLRERY